MVITMIMTKVTVIIKIMVMVLQFGDHVIILNVIIMIMIDYGSSPQAENPQNNNKQVLIIINIMVTMLKPKDHM